MEVKAACVLLIMTMILAVNASADQWNQVTPLPFARSDETADTVNGLIYLTGGCNGIQLCDFTVYDDCSCTSITNDTTVFDPAFYTYTTLPAMPIPRYRHISCVWLDSIFIFGGRTLDTDTIIYQVDVFNTTTRTWSTQPNSAPSDLGSDNSCFTIGNTIYVMGGYNQDYSISTNATYRYYPANDTWDRDVAQMVYGRGDFAAVALNGKGYVYGGYQASNFCVPINYVEEYDPSTDTWTPRASLGDDIAEKKDGVVLNGRIFSVGGEKKSLEYNCFDWDLTPVRDVFSYDSVLNTWRNETYLPDGRFRFAASVVASRLYIFGGQGPLVNDTTSVFFPVLSSVYEFNYPITPTPTPTPTATSVTPTQTPTPSVAANTSTGLSSADIAGIVIGVIVGLAILALIVFVVRRDRLEKARFNQFPSKEDDDL